MNFKKAYHKFGDHIAIRMYFETHKKIEHDITDNMNLKDLISGIYFLPLEIKDVILDRIIEVEKKFDDYEMVYRKLGGMEFKDRWLSRASGLNKFEEVKLRETVMQKFDTMAQKYFSVFRVEPLSFFRLIRILRGLWVFNCSDKEFLDVVAFKVSELIKTRRLSSWKLRWIILYLSRLGEKRRERDLLDLIYSKLPKSAR